MVTDAVDMCQQRMAASDGMWYASADTAMHVGEQHLTESRIAASGTPRPMQQCIHTIIANAREVTVYDAYCAPNFNPGVPRIVLDGSLPGSAGAGPVGSVPILTEGNGFKFRSGFYFIVSQFSTTHFELL